jgi:hypothetical protein
LSDRFPSAYANAETGSLEAVYYAIRRRTDCPLAVFTVNN